MVIMVIMVINDIIMVINDIIMVINDIIMVSNDIIMIIISPWNRAFHCRGREPHRWHKSHPEYILLTQEWLQSL